MTIEAIVAAARASRDWAPLVGLVPYAQFLGVRLDIRGDQFSACMPFDKKLIGNPALPALHGGTLGALLESTAIFELFYASQTLVLPKTITFTIDYLRSAKPVDTFAKGTITKHGRRVVTVSVRAWQEDPEKPVATANAHLLVMAPEQ